MNSIGFVLLSVLSFVAAEQIPRYVELNDGKFIPIIGYGSGGARGDKGIEALKYAIEVGYRHIDTAFTYKNEKEVGKAIKQMIDAGKVKREDLFVVTKVANNYHTREDALKSIKLSLGNLSLSYVDLALIHWPFGVKEGDETDPVDKDGKPIFSDIDYLETWKGLEDVRAKGLAKSIGVSNFNHLQIERLIKNSKVRPVMNQVECHPYFNQQKLIEFCQNNSIAVTAYSPLGQGADIKDATIKSIADKYNKTAAEVILRYHIERNVIAIPSSLNYSRIEENFRVLDFSLAQDHVKKINGLNTGKRLIDPVEWMPGAKNHKYYPFNEPY